MTTKILSVVFALRLPIRLLSTSHCLPRVAFCALAAIFLSAGEAPAQNNTNCALVMNCPSNIVVTSCFNVQEFYSPTASNICCGVNSTVTCNPPSGSIFALGTTTTVNCTATDCAQNTNFCSFTVTVIRASGCATNDLQVQCPTNIVVASCTNIQVFYAPIVTDPVCSNWTVVLSPPSGTYFAPNTTTLVDCFVGDYCGLTNDCSFTVTVSQPIVSYTNILYPGYNFVANPLNNPNGNTANILFTNPAGAHDFDMLEVPNCGSNNTVYTVDSSSPTGWADATDSFPVTPPTVPPGQGVIYQNNSGGPETVVFTGYEDCSPQPSPLCPCGTPSLVGPIYPGPGTYQNITGQSPQPGSEVITFNGAGFNTNTYNGSAWLPNTPVLAIGQAAYILVPCPTNCITLVCPANIVLTTCSNCVPAYYAATATNVCCHSNVVVQYSVPSGTCFPLGTNTVNITAYDPDCASTPPVSCSFTVTVLPGANCTNNCLQLPSNNQPQNLFVVDSAGHTIYEITPAGVKSVFASGLPDSPIGLAIDSGGDLFVADSNTGTIIEITPGGVKSTFASGLDEPWELAFDSAGNLFVAEDAVSGDIKKFVNNGGVLSSTPVLFAGGLYGPVALAFDHAGNLFVAEALPYNSDILEFTPGGIQSTFASGLTYIFGIAFDSAGNLFATTENNVLKFINTGGVLSSTPVLFVNNPGNANAVGLAFNSAGDLFVSEDTNPFQDTAYVSEFTPAGIPSTFASPLYQPWGLAFTPVPAVSGLTDIAVTSCTNIPVTYSLSVTDVCCTNWSVTYSPPSGSYFSPGTTNTVTVSATDTCGNSNNWSFTVTVLPGVNCASNCCENCTAPYPENYTVTILPVTNWVVNSLCQGTNTTLGTMLPDGNGALNGLQVYIWDPVTQSYLTDFSDSVTSTYANGWINGGNESVPPGTGIEIIDTSGVVYTITISGCQPDCPPPCLPGNQWTLVGGTGTNAVLTWTNLFSCPPVCGTEIQIINPTNQVITTYTYMNGAWMPPLPVPLLAVGQAAQVEVNTNLGMVVSCPPGKTVQCGTDWTFDTPVVATCCSQLLASSTAGATNVLIIPTTTVTNGACPQMAITQNWLIVDGCGDSNTCSQTVTVLGCCNTNCLQIACPTNQIVACGDTWSFVPPDAITCCSNLVYTLLSSNLISSTPCQTVYQGVWQVTDSCSNSAVCTQLVTVVNSGVPFLMPGIVLDYATLTNAGIIFAGGSFNFVNNGNGVQFDVDDVYGGIGDSIGFDGYISGGPFGIGAITISGLVQTAPVTNTGVLHISDGTYQLTGTIQWVDATTIGTSGVLNLNGVVNLTGITYPGSSSDLQSLVASGSASVDLTFQFIPGKTLTQLVATGGATDFSGTIEGSSFLTTPPLISCSTNKTVPCGAQWSFDPPVPYIGCCTNWTIAVLNTMTNSLSSSCTTNYTRTWQVSDCCSNTAICSQTVTVQGCCSNAPCLQLISNTPVLFVANSSSYTVAEYNSQGVGTIFASLGLFQPTGLAVDSSGNVFVSNYSYIEKYNPQGVGAVFATSGVNSPQGLAFDSAGNLYVANQFGDNIEKFDPSGAGTIFASGLDSPVGLAFDNAGNLYVANLGPSKNVVKINSSGVGTVFASSTASLPLDPIGLAVDSAGNVYLANQQWQNIVKFTPSGVGAVFASVLAPHLMTLDDAGNLYVTSQFNTVTKIDPSGASSIFASSGPNNYPFGLAFSASQPVAGPTNIVITSCTNIPVYYSLSVTDVCCTNWSVTYNPTSGSLFAPGTTTTVTVSATDSCGNSNNWDFTVTVIQGTNCSCLQIQCPTNKTVESCSAWSFDPPIATTCCSNLINAGTTGATNLVIIPVSTVTNGSCPEYTVTQTWLISDGCDDTNTCSQTVTVLCCTNCCGTNAGPRNIEWLQAPAPGSMPLYADPLGLNTNGTWIITNLPCYGRVLITQTFPDNNSPDITYWFLNPNLQGVPGGYGSFADVQAGYGPYSWGTYGSMLDFYDGHSNTNITYNLNFYFLDGPPNPCTLYLAVVGLASNTTATVSQPVTFRAEYDLVANAPGGNGYASADTTLNGVWGPSVAGTSGTVVGSAWGDNRVGDPSNTGWAVLQPDSPVPLVTLPPGSGTDINGNNYPPTTNQYPCLTLAVNQQAYDGIGFSVGYVCCPTNCLQVECSSNKMVQCGQSWMFDPPVVTTCCTSLKQTSSGLLTNILITPTTLVTNGVCPQYITQSWLIQDGCGESAACSQTVTLLCCTNPCLQVICPTNLTLVTCSNCAPLNFAATAIDQCCSNVQIHYLLGTTFIATNYCFPLGVSTVQVMAVDGCSNIASCDFTVTVLPGTNCSCLQVECATNKTVENCSAWDFDLPVATSCCTNVLIAPISTVTNGSCPEYTVTRTWLIEDGCNDTNICSQTVTVLCCTNCCGTNAGPRNIEWLQAPAANSMPLYADPLGLNTNGTWIITNLPCYGRVLVTQTFPDNNSPDITYWFLNSNFVGVPRAYGSFQDVQGGYGPYDWGSFGSILDFYNGHSNSDIKYNVKFYFLDGPPNPCTLYLGVVGLASNTTVTVSQPVIFRAEYDLAANAPGGNGNASANTTLGGLWGPAVPGTSGTVVGSAWGMNGVGDPSNTGWAVLQPNSPVPLVTLPSGSGTDINGNSYPPITNQYPCLTLAVDQEGYDGIGFTVGYVCCPTNCLQVECSSNKTVQCGQSWMFDPPVVTTCCTNLRQTTSGLFTNILITPTTLVTNGVCPQYITQSWLIQDGCDESASCSQTVTVLCCTNPCLQVICPTNLTLVTCSNCAPLNFAATAIDQCCSNVQIHYLLGTALISTNYCFPLGTSTVQVTAVDGCSNIANCDFTVTVVPGTNCPCLQVQCATNKTVESCVAWDFDTPVASSCCTNVLIVPVSTMTNGSCPQYTVTRTWLITDGCDDTNACSQTVTVLCCTNPCLEVICPTNVTLVTCSNCAPLKFMATATDQCCSNVQISYFFAGARISTNYCFPLGTNFVQVVATDSCNNMADCGFTVTVLPGTNCCLHVQCPTNKTVQSCVAWSFDSPIATTCCTNPVHIGSTGITNILIQPVSTVTNGSCPQYTVTRTWLITDGCDDTNVCGQTVTVLCCTNPCLEVICPTNVTLVTCSNCAPLKFMATATDQCCSNVQISYFFAGAQISTNYCFPLGTNFVQVVATDSCTNVVDCGFTVTVLPCNNTNCIDLICPAAITNTVCGSNCAPVSFAATAIDYCCTNLGVSYRLNSNLINTNHCFPAGLSTVSVTATDACGNIATCSFTVTVLVVTNLPAFLSVPTNVVICEGTSLSGAVIVDSDEWDNSDPGFSLEGYANGAAYVTNCANYLTGNAAHGTNILICSSDFSLNGSNLPAALIHAGYAVHYSGPPLPAVLSSYAAIYVSSNAFTAVELGDLQTFVCSGGGLYIAAGTGSPGGAVGESAQWNTILNGFGLNLTNVYDGIIGTLTIPSPLQVNGSPVMDSITAIYNESGNDVNTIAGYPQAQIIASDGTEGLIGVSACITSGGNCGLMPNLSGQVTTSGGAFTQSIPPGTVICNNTNVTLTISNACGSTNITIPVILINCSSNCINLTCPTNVTLTTCSNCAPLKFAATATDLCCSNVQISYFFAGAQISTNYCFPLGTNFVQVVATDSCTNMADCGFTVTVLPGTNCGCFHIQCPTNKLVGCSAWTFDPPTATTCCTNLIRLGTAGVTNLLIETTSTVTNGVCPHMNITRTWLIVDGCNNSAKCSQTVTVTNCCTNCITIICPTNVFLTTCSNCVPVKYLPAQVTDTCCSNQIIVNYSKPSGYCFPPGTNIVTVTAEDGCHNIATCEFTVTVIQKNCPPIIYLCPTNFILCTGTNGCTTMPDEVNATLPIYYALYNTGVGPGFTATPLPAGALGDPHWNLVSVPAVSSSTPLEFGTNTQLQVNAAPGWLGADNLSAWIAPANDATNDGPEGNYDYQTTLVLPAATTVTISGQLAADDSVVDVLLNGASTGLTISNSFAAGDWSPFTITGPGLAGTNTIDFVVHNNPLIGSNPPADNQDTPTGLLVEFNTVTTTTLSLVIPAAVQATNCDGTAATGWQSIPPGTRLCNSTNIIFTFTNQCGDATTCTSSVTLETCCVPPPSGMVLWLTLDESVGDTCLNSAGYNNGLRYQGGSPATPANGPTHNAGQYVDNSLCFNGNAEEVVVPNYTAIDFSNQNFTLDAWVKWNGGSGTQVMVDHRTNAGIFSSTYYGYSWFLYNGRPALQLANGSAYNFISTNVLPVNVWIHLAVTVQRGSVAEFYVNGAFTESMNIAGVAGSLYNTANLWVGNSPIVNSGPLSGCMDEIEIFDRALLASEIAGIYDAGHTGKCRPTGAVPASTAICFNDNTVTVTVEVCNSGSSTMTLAVSFNGLSQAQAGGPPAVNGPTVFTGYPPSVTLPPYTCTNFNVTITRPPGLTGSAYAYYQMVIRDPSGQYFSSIGKLTDLVSIWCNTVVNQNTTQVIWTQATNLVYNVNNPAGSAINFNSEVVVLDQNLAPETNVVSLNGLPPGTAVTNPVVLGAFGSQPLPVNINYLDARPWKPFSVVLLLNLGDNGAFVPVASTTFAQVMPPTVGPLLSAGATNGQLVVTWDLVNSGWTLRSQTSLNGTNWIPVNLPVAPMPDGSQGVTLPLTNTAQFFQLFGPNPP